MNTFNVPTRNEVNDTNKAIFDSLKEKLGFVPNLYATYAHSDTALETYLNFSGSKTSLSAKEKEIINLVVSEVNKCVYCLSAHTAVAKMNGFTNDEILALRNGEAPFNTKWDALVKVAKHLSENRGRTNGNMLEAFFNAGYTKGNLVDVIVLVGEKTISNYLHNTTQVPVDFPEVVTPLSAELA